MVEAIFKRRSVRSFRPGTLTAEQVKLLLAAGMQAPSACNTQAWEFIVIQTREGMDRIADRHPYAKACREAALAIVVCARPDKQSGISGDYFSQDCAAVTENILIQAVDMGLGAVWCGVYPKEKLVESIRKLLEIPEPAIPFNVIAIGYPKTEPVPVDRYDEAKIHYEKY